MVTAVVCSIITNEVEDYICASGKN